LLNTFYQSHRLKPDFVDVVSHTARTMQKDDQWDPPVVFHSIRVKGGAFRVEIDRLSLKFCADGFDDGLERLCLS